MIESDERQNIFESFEVPDPVRIRKVGRLLKAHVRNVQGLSVLECGVCKGGIAELFSKEGAACFGVDLNPRAVDGVTVYRYDLNQGFPDFKRQFDIIFAGEVMEHLYDDMRFLKSCHQLLNPGGILALTVPNLVFSVNRLLMLFGKEPMFAYEPYHYHIYTKTVLRDLVTNAGFEVLDVSSSHVLFSTRRHKVGRLFEILADWFPSFGAHLIFLARKS